MTKKRTIDAYFGIPKAKKPRYSDTQVVTDGESASYSKHASYPFPIPHLPDALEAEISGSPAREARVIADQPDLDLLHFEPYISRSAARQLFEFLRSELPFYRVEYDIARGGIKTHIRTPRWTTVFGVDETARFEDIRSAASGLTADVLPLKDAPKGEVVDARTRKQIPVGKPNPKETPGQKGYKAIPRPIPYCLDLLRRSTEAVTGCNFNFCLVNYYASGADSISFHSDDERFLGSLPAIASFSLGAKRDFLMKHKPPKPESGETACNSTSQGSLKLPLLSGDMVLMRGKTQANWLHSIPKRSGKNEWDGGRINITFRQALVRGGTENYYQYNVGSGPVYKWNAAGQEMIPWIQPSRP
ncbi:DNA repair family protein [Xylaria bambusicola]|uniref:DNA repair family protein n=1 Tax=Xylaria bambusicola TaxID=326684 RepID=UPI002007D824|nr:DNA repair family protein [Xylaria bambusicola]KAI0515245.1 DNA repair family protein [Xylaria bambusicola]